MNRQRATRDLSHMPVGHDTPVIVRRMRQGRKQSDVPFLAKFIDWGERADVYCWRKATEKEIQDNHIILYGVSNV